MPTDYRISELPDPSSDGNTLTPNDLLAAVRSGTTVKVFAPGNFTADDDTNPGKAGLVPAPQPGDAAAFKVLAASGNWVDAGGNAFGNISVGGVTVAADSAGDTLTLTAGTGVALSGDAGTDTVTIATTGTAALNTQTAAYTVVLGDEHNVIEVNVASAVNVTIPTNATAAIPVGSFLIVKQRGAGSVTLVGASGVTLNFPSDKAARTRAQYSFISAYKRATDEWDVAGDLGDA